MRDFFGKPRFHCTVDGCTCANFEPLKNKIAEEEGADAAGKYKSCQARSMVELTCGCNHNVTDHADKPLLGELLDTPGAASYAVTQGVIFRKPGFDPSPPKILRVTGLPPEAEVLCTGLQWRGPRGGLWVELCRKQKADKVKGGGWLLLQAAEGEGFGVSGPLLRPTSEPVVWTKGGFHILPEDQLDKGSEGSSDAEKDVD